MNVMFSLFFLVVGFLLHGVVDVPGITPRPHKHLHCPVGSTDPACVKFFSQFAQPGPKPAPRVSQRTVPAP
jgi:hypothetical protein